MAKRSSNEQLESGIFEPGWKTGQGVPASNDFFTPFFPTHEAQAEEEPNSSPLPLQIGRTIVAAVILILVGRLGALQISQGKANVSLAEGNRLRTTLVPAPRGLILDRAGVSLVSNSPNFSIVLHISELPKEKDARADEIKGIAQAIGDDPAKLSESIRRSKSASDLVLLDRLARDDTLKYEIRLATYSAAEIVKAPDRAYQPISSIGHLLGYIGKTTQEDLDQDTNLLPSDLIGKTGLEKTYDKILRGALGQEISETDASGRTFRIIGEQPATVGGTLILGLDSELQKVAATALRESIDKNQAKSGALVAMDPRSGEIRAMVSIPDFDSNLFGPNSDQQAMTALLKDPATPLVNRAIAGQYPSGSTVKPFVATGGLEEKVITGDTKIDTSAGEIVIGQWTFRDWKKHGLADVRQAIAESNNIFFYTVGGGNGSIKGLGADRLDKWLTKFGFSKKTGIDLPGEAEGLVPTPEWKKKVRKESWYVGDTYNLSIGQGDLLITPLQLATATSAVANGGSLLQPRVAHSYLVDGKTTDLPVTVRDKVGSPDNLAIVRQGMRQAVTGGSARSFNSLPVEIAAKTGTAQFTPSKEKTHSWFTAFGPYANPELAVSVIIEGGGEGYSVAAPVAKNVLEKYFNLPLTPIVAAPAE